MKELILKEIKNNKIRIEKFYYEYNEILECSYVRVQIYNESYHMYIRTLHDLNTFIYLLKKIMKDNKKPMKVINMYNKKVFKLINKKNVKKLIKFVLNKSLFEYNSKKQCYEFFYNKNFKIELSYSYNNIIHLIFYNNKTGLYKTYFIVGLYGFFEFLHDFEKILNLNINNTKVFYFSYLD